MATSKGWVFTNVTVVCAIAGCHDARSFTTQVAKSQGVHVVGMAKKDGSKYLAVDLKAMEKVTGTTPSAFDHRLYYGGSMLRIAPTSDESLEVEVFEGAGANMRDFQIAIGKNAPGGAAKIQANSDAYGPYIDVLEGWGIFWGWRPRGSGALIKGSSPAIVKLLHPTDSREDQKYGTFVIQHIDGALTRVFFLSDSLPSPKATKLEVQCSKGESKEELDLNEYVLVSQSGGKCEVGDSDDIEKLPDDVKKLLNETIKPAADAFEKNRPRKMPPP